MVISRIKLKNPSEVYNLISMNTKRKTVEICLPMVSYEHMYDYALLLSLAKKKFIKPVMWGLMTRYRVFEGIYIKIHSAGAKYYDNRIVEIQLIRIRDGKEEVIKTWEWEIYLPSEWHNCPKIIMDFVINQPGNTDYLNYSRLFENEYSDDDIIDIMKNGVCGSP